MSLPETGAGVDGVGASGDDAGLGRLAREVAEWCAARDAAGWADRMTVAGPREHADLQQAWFGLLAERGYAFPHWPAAWGGGRSRAEQLVVARELIQAGAPRLDLHFVALYHAAATLIVAGTPEQQQTYLTAIQAGQRWCQGFSEPEAGSDLASLRCRADPVPGGYRATGQKTWSTGAAHAEMCLLLARTGGAGRSGISYFLLDLASPGVEVHPIRNAAGQEEFAEIFLSAVFIPDSARVGAENEGWRIANATLSEERGLTMLERSEEMAAGVRHLAALVAGLPPVDRERGLETLGLYAERAQAFRLLVERVLDASAEGADIAAASILKLVYSELLQDISEAGLTLAGPAGHLGATGSATAWQSGHWFTDYLRSWEWTIGGGTNDVLRTVVGERVLGLPRGGAR